MKVTSILSSLLPGLIQTLLPSRTPPQDESWFPPRHLMYKIILWMVAGTGSLIGITLLLIALLTYAFPQLYLHHILVWTGLLWLVLSSFFAVWAQEMKSLPDVIPSFSLQGLVKAFRRGWSGRG